MTGWILDHIADHEGEALPAAVDVDTTILDDLSPEEVSRLLLEAAEESEQAYRRLRGYQHTSCDRQVDGPIPDVCRESISVGAGRGGRL